MTLLSEHLERHEAEAAREGFSSAPRGTFAALYTPEAQARDLGQPGWCRLWTIERDGKIIAHASAYDLGEGDIVYGHLGIEAPYRGMRLAALLQGMRGAFLDAHRLTLCGAVAPGNLVSLRGCLKNGWKVLRMDPDGSTWVYREPA